MLKDVLMFMLGCSLKISKHSRITFFFIFSLRLLLTCHVLNNLLLFSYLKDVFTEYLYKKILKLYQLILHFFSCILIRFSLEVIDNGSLALFKIVMIKIYNLFPCSWARGVSSCNQKCTQSMNFFITILTLNRNK